MLGVNKQWCYEAGRQQQAGYVGEEDQACYTRAGVRPPVNAHAVLPIMQEEFMPSEQNYKLVVLVKQVPDTHNVTSDAMTKDGTMNRAVLPAIFNPEDLNALEMALEFKERYGGEGIVLTMGPPKAAEVLRESLYRGADRVVLITDRKFAGADTLATSYTLKSAIEKLGAVDLVFCGRQAIDGDTAQVGPQTAEKLGIPQITYAESIVELSGDEIIVQRALDHGMEMVKCSMLADGCCVGQPAPPGFSPQTHRIQTCRHGIRVSGCAAKVAGV